MASIQRSRLAVIEVTSMRPEDPEYQVFSAGLVQRAVDRAEAVGFDVIRLQADSGSVALLDAVAGADAVLIMGGEDVAPEHYGVGRGYANESVHRPVADEAQLAVIRRAAQTHTPLLGICRGHQLINVAFGGTLITDLGDGHMHRTEDPDIANVLTEHGVRVSDDVSYVGGLGESLIIQSAHHQAIDRLGLGLQPIAWAPDGIIEAVTHRDLPITGVQWHPEAPRGAQDDFETLLIGLLAQITARQAVQVA